MSLRVARCTYRAARYACLNWHYSKSVPAGRLIKYGVWEGGEFKGVVLFGRGACPSIGRPYGLAQTEVCELVRIALKDHDNEVTRIVAVCLRLLKKESPGLRLVVSYADGNQGHLGKIYQAGNWIFVGEYSAERGVLIRGKLYHRRTVNMRYGRNAITWLKENVDPEARIVPGKPKYKYLMPLDKTMRKRITELSKDYPKEAAAGKTGLAVQAE